MLITVEMKAHPGTGHDFNRRVTFSTLHAYPHQQVDGVLSSQPAAARASSRSATPTTNPTSVSSASTTASGPQSRRQHPVLLDLRFVDWRENLYYQYRHYTQRFSQNTDFTQAAQKIDEWIKTGPSPG